MTVATLESLVRFEMDACESVGKRYDPVGADNELWNAPTADLPKVADAFATTPPERSTAPYADARPTAKLPVEVPVMARTWEFKLFGWTWTLTGEKNK